MTRAQEIIRQLDLLTQELSELAGDRDTTAYQAVDHVRVTMGFDKGGYVGQSNICELVDCGEFDRDEHDGEGE